MLSLSHIAIACSDIKDLVARLKTLSFEVGGSHRVETEGVNVSFVSLEVSPSLRLELLEPLTEDSTVAKFLAKRPNGGLHHLCFEVEKLEKWQEVLTQRGFEILSPGIRKGARGRVLFVHPKSFGGVLVELEEIK